MFKALTIAGSDTSGGAGIQADLKTFEEFKVYGMTALTVIVAQDPKDNWAHNVFPIDISVVEKQIDTVLGGIGVNAMKTGMLPSAEIIKLVADKLKEYGTQNIVIDPVMVCKGTDEVVNPEATDSLRDFLVPIADVVTPNLFEAGQLSGVKNVDSVEKMKEAAKIIVDEQGAKSVFITGGKKLGTDKATDLFYDGKNFELLESEIIETNYTHGAGCTTAAAVAANLARGLSIKEAVSEAKKYVTQTIRNGFKLNEYVGSVNHFATR